MFDLNNYIVDVSYKVEGYSRFNYEYINLYEEFESEKLKVIFSTLHYIFVSKYKEMNSRIKGNHHFIASSSRELMFAIETIEGMQRILQNTKYGFFIDEHYQKAIEKSNKFLSSSGGSTIPDDMEEVTLYHTLKIFNKKNSIQVDNLIDNEKKQYYNLKFIGKGSYANVYSFKDKFYNKKMVLKRAMNDLNDKEIERFKREFEIMQSLSSPYIIEVYRYDEEKTEYIMEFVDMTLYKFMEKNNSKIPLEDRKNLVSQVFHAFKYIHSKNILHRDIAPNNILIKTYDDMNLVKISDFGLVKIPDSTLTDIDSDYKGSFNDPILRQEGFNTYNISHEIYALTRVVFYIMTGKDKFNSQSIKNEKVKKFINRGTDINIDNRYKSVDEMIMEFELIFKDIN